MSRTDGEGELAGLQGKIPIAARVKTGETAGENPEDDNDGGCVDGTTPGDSHPPTTAPPPALDLEALSRNLAAHVGGHQVVMGNNAARSGTAQTHDTINSLLPLPTPMARESLQDSALLAVHVVVVVVQALALIAVRLMQRMYLSVRLGTWCQ